MTNEIYLDTWAREVYVFDSLQYSALSDIASQNPLSGGSGVYTARVMLGTDYDDFGPNENRIDVRGKIADQYLHIYPNPATDEVTVDYNIVEGKQGLIVFYDFTGRELFRETLAGGMNVKRISTAMFSSGIYHLRFMENDELIGNIKLAIMK